MSACLALPHALHRTPTPVFWYMGRELTFSTRGLWVPPQPRNKHLCLLHPHARINGVCYCVKVRVTCAGDGQEKLTKALLRTSTLHPAGNHARLPPPARGSHIYAGALHIATYYLRLITTYGLLRNMTHPADNHAHLLTAYYFYLLLLLLLLTNSNYC